MAPILREFVIQSQKHTYKLFSEISLDMLSVI